MEEIERMQVLYKRAICCVTLIFLTFNERIYFIRKLNKIINQIYIMRMLTARKSNRIEKKFPSPVVEHKIYCFLSTRRELIV